jgi:hypothetical protein
MQARTTGNRRPKKIFRSKQVGYLKWQNILLEYYIRLQKKGWKGLVGHPNDRGKYGNFSFFLFRILFLFLTAINLLMFVSMRKYCC